MPILVVQVMPQLQLPSIPNTHQQESAEVHDAAQQVVTTEGVRSNAAASSTATFVPCLNVPRSSRASVGPTSRSVRFQFDDDEATAQLADSADKDMQVHTSQPSQAGGDAKSNEAFQGLYLVKLDDGDYCQQGAATIRSACDHVVDVEPSSLAGRSCKTPLSPLQKRFADEGALTQQGAAMLQHKLAQMQTSFGRVEVLFQNAAYHVNTGLRADSLC